MAEVLHTYRYAGPSRVDQQGSEARALLSTSSPDGSPWFFEGHVREPELVASMLLLVSRLARTRFYTPPGMLAAILRAADPVVTANAGVLRFESFSLCNGAYARFDYPLGEWSSDLQAGLGTTNVDFGDAMANALTRIGRDDALILSVGEEGVEVTSAGGTAIERKVPLPDRWVRGFAEVQLAQLHVAPVFELSARSFRELLRSAPSKRTSVQLYAVPRGDGARLTTRAGPGAAAVGGIERLATLEPALRHARSVRVHAALEPDRATVWEVVLADDAGARFLLVLSPETSRGFSGEGRALDAIADLDDLAASVRDVLAWQPVLTPAEVARAADVTEQAAAAGMETLALAGVLGFDATASGFFHRELPFELDALDGLHPRLRRARKFVEGDHVRRVSTPEGDEYLVRSAGVDHIVQLDRDGGRCTCTWWATHAGTRGPCAHVTAARLVASA